LCINWVKIGKQEPGVFLSILQEEFLPCPVHPALFHNFGCCYIILMGHKKIKIKMNNINNCDEQICYDYS
jgi:hypothetical protein